MGPCADDAAAGHGRRDADAGESSADAAAGHGLGDATPGKPLLLADDGAAEVLTRLDFGCSGACAPGRPRIAGDPSHPRLRRGWGPGKDTGAPSLPVSIADEDLPRAARVQRTNARNLEWARARTTRPQGTAEGIEGRGILCWRGRGARNAGGPRGRVLGGESPRRGRPGFSAGSWSREPSVDELPAHRHRFAGLVRHDEDLHEELEAVELGFSADEVDVIVGDRSVRAGRRPR